MRRVRTQSPLQALALIVLTAAIAFPALSRAQESAAPTASAPMTELTFEGLLARNASLGYLGYLVRTRGLAFVPSPDLLAQLNRVGGSRLVSNLKVAKIVSAIDTSKAARQLTESLAQCAASFEKADYFAAATECSAAERIEPTNPWPLMGLAEIAIKQKKYSDAVSLAHEAVALAPLLADAHFSLGEAFAVSGQSDGADDELKEALQLDPNHVDALVMLGDLYAPSDDSDAGNAEASLSYYQRALAVASDAPEIHERLASMYSEKGESVAAIEEYATLGELQPTNDDWPRREAKLLEEAANYPGAVAAYDRLLAIKPDDVQAHYDRGEALIQQRKYAEAATDLRIAQRANPKDTAALVDLGVALENDGQFEPAVSVLDQALVINPKDCAAILNIGWARAREGRQSEALEQYGLAARCEDDNPTALDDLGIQLLNMGQPDKALPILQRLVEVAPSDAAGHVDLGAAFDRLKRFDDAEAEYRKAIQIAPQNVLAHKNLCKVLSQEARIEDAISACEGTLALDAHDQNVWDVLNKQFSREKRGDQQPDAAATSGDPKSALEWEISALRLENARQFDKALAATTTAVRLDPGNAAYHFELAGIYGDLHDRAREVAECQSALQLEPNDTEYIHALGIALWQTGDNAAAEPLFLKSAKAGSFIEDSLIYLGLISGGRNDFKAAAEYDKEAIAADPTDPTAFSNLALNLVGTKDTTGALAYAQQAVAMKPDYPGVHRALGYALVAQQKWPAAIAQFREAARLDPNNLNRQIELAQMLRQSGDLEGAKASFQLVLQREPNNAANWAYFGDMLMNMHEDAGARGALQKAVVLDPKSAVARNNLAWFYATCDDPKFRNNSEAVRLAKQANELTNWKSPNYIDTYAAALDAVGDSADAAIVEREAVYLMPWRADLQEALKRYEGKAANKHPDSQNAVLPH